MGGWSGPVSGGLRRLRVVSCPRGSEKGTQELHKLHKCLGMRRNPCQWYEPAGPTGDRHDAYLASMEPVPRRNGAAVSPTGARTARRHHKAMRAARGRVLLVSFRGGINQARNTRCGRWGNEAHAASPRSRAIATNRAATPAPPGLDVALIPVVPGVRGCRCGATTHCEAHAGMQGSLARELRPSMWNPRVRGWGL